MTVFRAAAAAAAELASAAVVAPASGLQPFHSGSVRCFALWVHRCRNSRVRREHCQCDGGGWGEGGGAQGGQGCTGVAGRRL